MSKEATLVPFELAHLDLMELRDNEKDTIGADKNKFIGLRNYGVCATIMYDGRILGVIGYLSLWPGVLEVFIIPSVYVPEYAKVFVKKVRELLRTVEATQPVRRFQTASLDDELHNRWMEFIGFTCEGVLKKYGVNGADYKLWSRVY